MKMRDFKGPAGILAVSMFLDCIGHTILIPFVRLLVGQYVSAAEVALMVGLNIATMPSQYFIHIVSGSP